LLGGKRSSPRTGSNALTWRIESYNRPPRYDEDTKVSKNIAFLERQVQKSDIFSERTMYDSTEQYAAVHLTLPYFVLKLDTSLPEAPTDYGLAEVYDRRHVVSNGVVDLCHLLHIRDFWRRHLTTQGEGTYHESYRQLGTDLRPRAWTRKLGGSAPLGNL
jgi:hypothetical protein